VHEPLDREGIKLAVLDLRDLGLRDAEQGIGLLLTQAIITQKDWEEVAYYIVLIVLMVMVMDTLSGWLRRRLIRGG